MGAASAVVRGRAEFAAAGVALSLLALLVLLLALQGPAGSSAVSPDLESEGYADMPLAFEPNAGRFGGDIDFRASAASGTVALTADGALLSQAPGEGRSEAAIRMTLLGAAPGRPVAVERLPGVVNDLRGNDPADWRTDVPTFKRVRYPEAYPGIDLDYHGTSGQLEYDFRVAAGADPGRIELAFPGADTIRVAPSGDLVIREGDARFRQTAPIGYQPSAGGRDPVAAAFTLNDRRVGFEIGPYDESRALVIDPLVLDYSTFLGGDSNESGAALAVDSSGSAYVTGYTNSTDFNTVGPIEGDDDSNDVFVSKLNPAGSALVYSTYIGGDGSDEAKSIAVDSAGAAYVTGLTTSSDFNTAGPIEGDSADSDVFVAKLNAAGNGLVYSTYLGGDGFDLANGIAVDASGSAYVTGQTGSTDFDTSGPIEGDSADNDVFVSKLNPSGSALTYSTYLGGGDDEEATSIAVDAAGAAYVAGFTGSTNFDTAGPIEGDSASEDAFVSKLNPAGSALAYSTYLGGDDFDGAAAIDVDAAGAAYVVGETNSTDFNTAGAIEGNDASSDAFVSKLNPAGSALAYSTYLGGGSGDTATAIAVDADGSAYVAGQTNSTDFNVAGQIEGDSPFLDVFVSKLNPAGSALQFSTYIGGGSNDQATAIAIAGGAAYVAGNTVSSDYDTAGPIEGASTLGDVFISKLDPTPETTIGSGPSPGTPIADRTPTFSFTSSEPASTFECRLDGGPFGACSSPFTTPELGDGSHVFEVRALDSSANPDDVPAGRDFVVDLTAPGARVTKAPRKLTLKRGKRSARARFEFTSDDPDATFECRIDAGAFASCASPVSAKLRKGRHTFAVRAADALGNVDETPAIATVKVKRKKRKK